MIILEGINTKRFECADAKKKRKEKTVLLKMMLTNWHRPTRVEALKRTNLTDRMEEIWANWALKTQYCWWCPEMFARWDCQAFWILSKARLLLWYREIAAFHTPFRKIYNPRPTCQCELSSQWSLGEHQVVYTIE